MMKPSFGTMFLALTVACVAEGLVFQPPAPAAAESSGEVDLNVESADDARIRSGLTSLRVARRTQ